MMTDSGVLARAALRSASPDRATGAETANDSMDT
jgi:hypothetical protein